jgi:D-alanine-D-alanine ligase
MKIAVLMGGISEEREVSLQSGVQVARALREKGHEVLALDTSHGVLSAGEEASLLDSGIGRPPPPAHARDLLRTGNMTALIRESGLGEVDVAFPALHGRGGEDGTIQTLLELTGIPFAGSDRVGCTLSMDKDLTKRLLREAGLDTPAWITVRGREEAEARLDEVEGTLGLPLIVKPPSGGSTLGLTLAHDREELVRGLELALSYEDRVLFEEYVQGREITVGILEEEALPVGEIIPEHELFDYECKYEPGMAQEIFPAELPDDVAEVARNAALAVHRVLLLRDFSRVDFILDREGRPRCLEANALPGLTGNSLVPQAARAAGIPFPDFCHRIAELGRRRSR